LQACLLYSWFWSPEPEQCRVDGRPVAWVARAQACVLERQRRDWLSQHQPLRMIRDIGAGTLAWDDVAHPVGAHAPDSCQLRLPCGHRRP
jgi:hypothetical protein